MGAGRKGTKEGHHYLTNLVSLEILFQDPHFVVIDKPSGLIVHPYENAPASSRNEPSCVSRLSAQLGELVYPVHRLDRGTSGALLFARSSDAARAASKHLAEGAFIKKYLAVVRGVPPASGRIDVSLARDVDRDRKRRIPIREPVRAETHFETLASVELPFAVSRYPSSRYSLLRVRTLTGVRHQIRRHLVHLRHPLIGDTWYGEGRHNRFFRETYGIERLLLAAESLEFPHPFTGASVKVKARAAPELSRLFETLGWNSRVD